MSRPRRPPPGDRRERIAGHGARGRRDDLDALDHHRRPRGRDRRRSRHGSGGGGVDGGRRRRRSHLQRGCRAVGGRRPGRLRRSRALLDDDRRLGRIRGRVGDWCEWARLRRGARGWSRGRRPGRRRFIALHRRYEVCPRCTGVGGGQGRRRRAGCSGEHNLGASGRRRRCRRRRLGCHTGSERRGLLGRGRRDRVERRRPGLERRGRVERRRRGLERRGREGRRRGRDLDETARRTAERRTSGACDQTRSAHEASAISSARVCRRSSPSDSISSRLQ